MLDNSKKESIATEIAMLPTTVTTAATTAIPIANCNYDDVNKNLNTTTNANTSPTKVKTIFNWLKSATNKSATFDNTTTATTANCNNSNSSKRRFSANLESDNSPVDFATVDACTCETAKRASKTASNQNDVTLREFRGVQSLRHLWNKRISSYEETSSSYKTFSSANRKNKLTKSISCLVNATNAACDAQQHTRENDNDNLVRNTKRTHTKRAQSLHDCTQLAEQNGESEADIDFLHREKDNFYKYKTAEQAAKHLLVTREVKVRAFKTKRLAAGIASESSTEDAHFPAIKASDKGERIHWPTREDIFCQGRRANSSLTDNEVDNNAIMPALNECNQRKDNATSTPALSANGIAISNAENNQQYLTEIANKKQIITSTATSPANSHSESSLLSLCSDGTNTTNTTSTSDTLTGTQSPQYSSRKRIAERETAAKRCSNDSANSSSSNLTASGGRATRRASSAASRKYSFKTHNRAYHHTTRKMNKDGSGTSIGMGSGAGTVSMVAKLTQQFNELIQKDKTLLEEVKRKNGVLMSRGGHVYKVVETTKDYNSKNALTNNSPNISRSGSHAKDVRTSMVQRNIKKFESDAKPQADERPEVPAKSQQVLRKLSEHEPSTHKSQQQYISLNNNNNNNNNSNSNTNSKRLSLNLMSHNQHQQQQQQQSNHKDVLQQNKVELRKTQLTAMVVPLEVVKEEVKTPLENEEEADKKSIAHAVATVTFATATAADSNITTNVLNTKVTESTYNDCCNLQNSSNNSCNNNNNNIITNSNIVSNVNQAEIDNITAHKQMMPNDTIMSDAIRLECRQPPEGQEDIAAEQPNQITKMTKTCEMSNKANLAQAEGFVIINTPDSNDDDPDGISDEKLKQRKHRYAKLYEKFRFRSPFSGNKANKSRSPSASPEKSTPTEQLTPSTESLPSLLTPDTSEAEAKILDALQVIDQKLKNLHEESVMTTATDYDIILCENDDFEQRVLPNNSFIYQSNTKQVSNNQLIVTQAVNVTLVNSIEGEQMIMEQKELQQEQANISELPIIITIAQVKQQPMLQQQEEEAMYEPIAEARNEVKTENLNPQRSFLHKQYSVSTSSGGKNKTNELTSTEVTTTLPQPMETQQQIEDIYQTLEEVVMKKETTATAVTTTAITDNLQAMTAANMLNDYESIAGSCEQTLPAIDAARTQYDDGYEICEPPATEAIMTTRLQPTTPTNATATLMRNTNDELPELPKPKRRLPKSPMPGRRPVNKPTSENLILTNITTTTNRTACITNAEVHNDSDEHHYYADDENIYDTIKGSHCYESLHTNSVNLQKSYVKGSDTVSLTSNCYESITQYRRIITHTDGHAAGSNSGSTLTISSDHKTNSLYEVSLAAGLLYGGSSIGCGSSTGSAPGSTGNSVNNNNNSIGAGSDGISNHYSHSNAGYSDNSDEWVDISDNDADGEGSKTHIAKQQFIVVRERSKVHRSPDWSKRVRDKRLNQKAMSCIEDDSDHYYESLSPLGNKRHSTQLVERSNSHHKRNQDLPKYALGASQRNKKYSASAHALGHGISDDNDSFDTDTDDIYETEEQMKNHNDSGVDIRNLKLPEPPSSTNQVYAIVRKFKNFISNKKSSGQHKHGGSQQKLYENSSQFYVNGNIYENTPKSSSKTNKYTKKPISTPITPLQDDIYENTEFHTPPIINANAKQLSTSEKNLSVHDSNKELVNAATLRSKSKSGKSFKSRLRKSLGAATFENKQFATLTPTRSTFYIEDPSHGGSGELDSGFSEKASSGDLPVMPSVPTPESQKFSTVARKAKKDSKSNNSQRRRTSLGIRPHEPPPPPPEEAAYKSAKYISGPATTSWYAECGVFKNASNNVTNDEHSVSGSKSTYSQNGSMIANGSSWYAEAGLYQTSGISVASSSGSSGVSTGNEGGLGDDMPHSMFQNEPLYQIYSAAKLESISRDMADNDSSTDGYEEIGQNGIAGDVGMRHEEHQKRPRPSAFQLIEPKNGPSRTLWSEIPEVINSCILPTLTPRERALQEAKFEIITSEASYLKSLNLLRCHYMNHPVFRDINIVSARDRKALFSYIVPVHECSERLLMELESCWQDNIMLLGLSKRIFSVAEKYFHVYIAFCEHQGRMDRTLRRLKEAKGLFSQNLDLLEASPTCCGLNLHSFLMLPMQRITRLPLLIDAVFSKVSHNDDEYESWKMTFAIMNKIVTQCNEAANRCEQAYEIERISRQLEFTSSIRALAIAPVGVPAPGSKPRFLVKKGELTHLIWRGDDAKLTFGKKFTKATIFAFLFSDLLVLTKRKAEELFQVFDYCPRNMLTISSGDTLPQLPTKDINQTGKNLILMTLLENHERKTVELVLSCPSVSEQQRWLQAMRPPEVETPGEKLYEQWDCPQVIVKHTYETKEPDILNLEIGDVVNVTRKLPDGWYQGERIRDGAIGWFPGSYAEELNSAHVRARNLKQRYRLLTYTATYLESQKRK